MGVDLLYRFEMEMLLILQCFFIRFSMLRRKSTQVFENARHAFYIVIYHIKSTFVLFTLERFRFEFTKYDLKVHIKNNVKICVFLTKKSSPKRFLRESRDRFFAKAPFFEFGGLQMVPESSPGRLGRPLGRSRGALGGLLGALGGLLGSSWGALGRSWGVLGTLFDPPGGVRETSGPPRTLRARFWTDT